MLKELRSVAALAFKPDTSYLYTEKYKKPNTKKLKLLILGHGRHGKDTVSAILKRDFNFKFQSSSKFCSELFIYDRLKQKYSYKSEEDCYNDRHNHRAEWYDAICEYNTPNAARLGIEIFKTHDIYCGLRNKREFYAMKNTGVFDYAIWVDRSNYLPAEPKSSMTIEEWMTDYTIDNNGSLKDLEFNTHQLVNYLFTINNTS